MDKKSTSLLIIGMMSLGLLLPMIDTAYGHGIHSGIVGKPIRIEDETFSAQSVGVAGEITIKGTIVNLRGGEYLLSPSLYVERLDKNDDSFLQEIIYGVRYAGMTYGLHQNVASKFFQMHHDLPYTITIKPSESIDYALTIVPQTAGVYHVHSLFHSSKGPLIAPGQTVTVTAADKDDSGNVSTTTLSDAIQTYLPLGFGFISLVFLQHYARKRPFHRVRIPLAGSSSTIIEKALRGYFVVKATFETAWLSGLVLNVIMTAQYIGPIEIRFSLYAAFAVFLFAVMSLGFLAIVINKTHDATKWFYLALTSTSSVFYFVYAVSMTGSYAEESLRVNPFVLLGTVVANAVLSGYLAFNIIRKRRNKTKRIAARNLGKENES